MGAVNEIRVTRYTNAISEFANNLQNAADMTDVRSAVEHLAQKIGASDARDIANMYGLHNSYYFVRI